ncbi:MAG TPA: MFS transporter [Pseudonocardia sp.]|jgi:MFS family permease
MALADVPRDLWIASAVIGGSTAGDMAAQAALTLRLHDAGVGPSVGSGWSVSALLLANTVPAVLCAPLAGRFADRYDSRRLLVGCATGCAALCLALAAVPSGSAAGAGVALLVLIGVVAVLSTVATTVLSTLLPTMAGAAGVVRASTLLRGTTMVSGVLGLAVGSAGSGWFGTAPVLLADAASFGFLAVGSALLTARRVGRPPRAAAHRAGGGRSARSEVGVPVGGGSALPWPGPPAATTVHAGARTPAATALPIGARAAATTALSAAARTPATTALSAGARVRRGAHRRARSFDRATLLPWAVTASYAMVLLQVSTTNVAQVFFVKDVLGAGDLGFGLVSGAWTVGTLLALPVMRSVPPEPERLVRLTVLGEGVVGVAILGCAVLPSPVLTAGMYVLGGVGTCVMQIARGSFLQLTAPQERRGRVLAGYGAVVKAASVAALGLGGVLLELVGARGVYLVAGTGAVVVATAAGLLCASRMSGLATRSSGSARRAGGPAGPRSPGRRAGDHRVSLAGHRG